MPRGIYKRAKSHGRAISKARKGYKHSQETKDKIGLANKGLWINFSCDYCGKENEEQASRYKRKDRHFCNMDCYSSFRKEKLSFTEQHAYRGIRSKGKSKQVYHQRYVAKKPHVIAHLKARRYAREKGAAGNHTLKDWEKLKEKCRNRCVHCGEEKPLTKDHIVPLSEGGSDYINNIQPLCRSCNSKKWKKITTL